MKIKFTVSRLTTEKLTVFWVLSANVLGIDIKEMVVKRLVKPNLKSTQFVVHTVVTQGTADCPYSHYSHLRPARFIIWFWLPIPYLAVHHGKYGICAVAQTINLAIHCTMLVLIIILAA